MQTDVDDAHGKTDGSAARAGSRGTKYEELSRSKNIHHGLWREGWFAPQRNIGPALQEGARHAQEAHVLWRLQLQMRSGGNVWAPLQGELFVRDHRRRYPPGHGQVTRRLGSNTNTPEQAALVRPLIFHIRDYAGSIPVSGTSSETRGLRQLAKIPDSQSGECRLETGWPYQIPSSMIGIDSISRQPTRGTRASGRWCRRVFFGSSQGRSGIVGRGEQR